MGKLPLMTFFVIIIICCCGCIGPEEENTPESTIYKYYEGLNERDAEKVMNTLSHDVIESSGGETAILYSLEETINDLEEDNLVFEIETITSNIVGFQARVNATLKIYPAGSSEVSKIPYTFELIFENEKWKITDIS